MTTKPWSLAQACEAYASAGIAGVSPWVEHVEPVGTREAARIIASCGLRVPAYVRGGFFVHPGDAEREAAIDRSRRLIDDAHALGAEMLVIVPGARAGIPLGSAREAVADALAKLAPHAQQAGVKLALEPLHPMYAADRSCVNTLASARDLCARVAHPSLGIALDVYHVWWEPDLERTIAAIGRAGRLFAFHICDFKAAPAHPLLDRGLMGEGVIPISEIRHAVEAAGFEGLAEVEIFSERSWATDQTEFLARIIAAARAAS
ncbi:MAG: sugar phosphate isomerase/epimerase [Phycisphaerales bacterium]|nr:sugar phosphate isomerase/epimerase [Phycisphaerales bacterium]